MKISVITVSFNSEKTIERTILSVINQNYKDFEYIIIDGKSSDSTIKICEKYSKYITKIISEKDSGIYDAMNKGIVNASGDIISIINSDDYFTHKNCLTEVAENFSDDIDLLLGDVEIFSEATKKKKRLYSSGIFFPFLSRFGIQPPHPATFIRKSAYEKHGVYKTTYRIAADFELLTRFISVNRLKYRKIKKTFVLMSDGGISNSSLRVRNKTTHEIIESLKDNKIHTNIFFVNLRFLIKSIQFIKF